MSEAKRDCERLIERAEEDEDVILDELERIHTDANEWVATEKTELAEDRDKLSTEVDRIGEF